MYHRSIQRTAPFLKTTYTYNMLQFKTIKNKLYTVCNMKVKHLRVYVYQHVTCNKAFLLTLFSLSLYAYAYQLTVT